MFGKKKTVVNYFSLAYDDKLEKFKFHSNEQPLFEMYDSEISFDYYKDIVLGDRLSLAAQPELAIETLLQDIPSLSEKKEMIYRGYHAKKFGYNIPNQLLRVEFFHKGRNKVSEDQIRRVELFIEKGYSFGVKGSGNEIITDDSFIYYNRDQFKEALYRVTEEDFFRQLFMGVELAIFEKHLLDLKAKYHADKSNSLHVASVNVSVPVSISLPSPEPKNDREEGLPLPDFKHDTEKIAWLVKLGIIEVVKQHCKESQEGREGETIDFYDVAKGADILRSFTGIGFEHCRKTLEAIINPNEGNQDKHPLKAKKNQRLIDELSVKYGLKL